VKWSDWAGGRNAKARAKGRWRETTEFDAFGPRGALGDGRRVISFASNDYLGLASHPAVLAAAHAAIDRWGTGSSASRLVSGSRPVHTQLEKALASWKATEAALVFPTGYTANLGTLSALAGPQVLVCADERNHASIIDGCRLARQLGATVELYPHADAGAVRALLADWAGRAIVVSDDVFSMDGDRAPVEELARACADYDALLVLDEAHSVMSPHGGPPPCEVLRVGTLSKTLGSLGGFVAGTRVMTELLVNRGRPFIFSTALAPADAASAKAALDVLRSAEGAALVQRLEGYAARFRRPGTGPSPIVPIIVGTEHAALAASATLLGEGLWVPAIRPPTVPPGSCRLRVTLSAAHHDDEVRLLGEALARHGLWP
jgi:8-amino-7-oxononanoate synthase